MANKTITQLQTKLNKLALKQPQLQENKQWAEVLRGLEGLSQNTNRQELVLETIAAISDAASSILEVDDLLRVSVNLIQDYFDFYYVAIYLVDELNERVRLRAGTGEAGQLLLQMQFPREIGGESMIGWCVQDRQARIALDVGEEAVRFKNPSLPDTRSEMVLPLINRGQVIGALDLQSAEPAAFSQDDITLFQTLADQLANTIQNAQLFTENTRLLEQAENNRRFLKTVIEHIPDPIFIKDKNHTLLEMNQANAQVIGRSERELLGRTDRDFLPAELAEKFYQRDNEVFTSNQIFVAEDKTIWGDGQEHTAHTRLIPIPNSAGQPEYLLGITQDVTEVRAREAERERLLAETAALYKGSQTIASALSERQIFEALFDQIRLFEPCEISAFRFNLVDNEPTWAELRVNWQKLDNSSYPVGTRFYLPEMPQTRLLATTEPLFFDEIATDPRLTEAERASFAPTHAHSVAILPLVATGQQLGAIIVYFTIPFTFTEAIQRLWLAIADQVRVALANRQLIEEATYRLVRMETAAEVARAAGSILDLQELLNSAVALICDRFELYYVGAFLVDEIKEWAVLRAGTGEAGRIQLQKQHRLKIGGESMIGWCIYHRQPRIALDVGKEAVRFQNPDLPETRSELALPLIYHHEVIGALTVQSTEQAAFSREDIVFLQTMADQLANAVINARLFEQAQQEIVERAKIEEALRASETLYQSLVDNIPQNVLRKDREGRFVFGNKSFCNNLGISLDELVGKTDFDFYPVELAEKYRQDDQKVLKTGEIFETVEQNQSASGDEKYVRVVKSPIYDPSGEVAGIQGIFWDITERKQAEEALRESEARFRSLASNIPGAIYRCALDADRTMEFMSAATEALTGYPTSDFAGKRVRSYVSIIHPEDRVMVEKGVLEGVEAKQPYTVEYRIIQAGGQVRWVHERGQAIHDEAGHVLWLDGVLFDITERKQAEELLAKQARMTAFSADVGLALTKTMTLPEALQNCAESMVQHLDAAFARIWTLAPGENILMLRASAGMYTHLDGSHARVPLGMFKIGWIAQERQPHLTNTLAGDPHVGDQKWAKREGMIAFAGYPLLIEGRLVGVMAMFARKPLADDTLQAMEAVANTIALAIERKQAEEALKEAFQRTQLLYNITEALATLINQQAAFETVLGEYLLLLNVSRGGIMLLDPDGEYNTLQALYIDNKVVEPNLVFPAKEDLLAQYLQQNPFPLVIEDVSTDALTQHNQALRGQVESMLVVPVVTRGDVVGIIGADATEKGRTFTRDDIEIGKAIADQLAIWLENRQLLEEAQYRSERLQTAAVISRAASSILDVNQLINTSVNLIRDQFDFYYVGLFMVDKAREWAVLRAGTGEAGRIQLERKHQLKIGGESMIGWSIQNRQARIALDVGQEAVRFQNPVLPNTHSEMALPLISRDEVIGALTVQSTEQGAFLPEDITLLQTMADQLANAIENARLFESVMQAQREAEELLRDTQALQQFSQTLAGTLQINEIINIFFEACAQVMGFEYAIFCFVDKYQHRVKAIAGFGVTESNIKRANRSLDSQDIMVDIVKTGQTEIITGWDERLDRETFEAEGHNDWMRIFTPITLRQENIGLIEVGFNKNTDQIIEEAQIRLLRAFIDQTALALDNAQRYEASQRAARREALIKEITTKVRASTQIDTILQTTVKEVGDALSSKRAYVHLVSPTNVEAK